MAGTDDLQQRLDAIFVGAVPRAGNRSDTVPATAALHTPAPPRHIFSPFVDADMERAVALATYLIDFANAHGLPAALAEIERAERTEIPGLAQYAALLFMTHSSNARDTLRLPPLEQRQRFGSSSARMASTTLGVVEPKTVGHATPPEEDHLTLWREDPLLNEHHEHWHLVYPHDTSRTIGAVSRRGELFTYMHEQMLARYDAERLSAGLGRVIPLDDYTAPIPEGYDPGAFEQYGGQNQWAKLGSRPPGATLHNAANIKKLQGWHAKLMDAVGSNVFITLLGERQPVTIGTLGDAVESSDRSMNAPLYGGLHNIGHDTIAKYNPHEQPLVGVMDQTTTAIRDPIFFRWHKHIDNIFHAWQDAHAAKYDFTDATHHKPPVRIRKAVGMTGAVSADIILCDQGGLPPTFDGTTLGTTAFGAASDAARDHWEDDFSATTITLSDGTKITTTDTLFTEMQERTIALLDTNNQPVSETINYLTHDDFHYFLRVENLAASPQRVTVRIFLAPETLVEERSAWIEMDRFVYQLGASERAVIYRAADQSSVVRKPALRPQDLTPGNEPSFARDSQSWCDCGWPYTLLVPRGTEAGMAFRLFVMCSPGSDLTVETAEPGACSSISYCGVRDKDYPDTQAMGYPFDRPMDGGVAATVAANDNMAWRRITVRHRTG